VQELKLNSSQPQFSLVVSFPLPGCNRHSAPVSFAAPSASDSSEALADLASWASSTKARDEALRKDAAQAKAAGRKIVAPVRGHAASASEEDPAKVAAAGAKPGLDLGQELSVSKLLPSEIPIAAVAEKEKGNECFRAKEYLEAVKFYTRSLHLVPDDATTLNNRAITFLKLKNLDAALNDVSLVLQKDASNWKALWRRGQVWEGKLFLERALDDFRSASEKYLLSPESASKPGEVQPELKKSIKKVEQALFDSEPNHPYVAHLKTAKQNASASSKKPEEKEEKVPDPSTVKAVEVQKQFKRMQIAEVEDDEEEEEDSDSEQAQEQKRPEPEVEAPRVEGAPIMKRMPIQEVEDEDEDEAEEVVVPAKKQEAAAPKPAAAAAPAKPQPKPKAAAPVFHSKSGGMMIEEVSSDDEEEESKATAAKPSAQPTAAAASPAKAAPAASSAASPAKSATSTAAPASPAVSSGPFELPPVATTPLLFERDWRLTKQHAPHLLPSYLSRLSPSSLPRFFAPGRSGLSAGVFGEIAEVLAGEECLGREPQRTADFLTALQQTDRFALNSSMLPGSIKKSLKAAMEKAQASADETLRSQLQSLIKRYC
jgi:tetratricopeptide (TPR) repeat protein